MLNLFKRKSEVTTQEMIAEIHNEFNTAGDKLLSEALELIKPHAHLLEKAEKLKRIGFVNTAEVSKAKEVKVSQAVADMVESYRVSYPNNKFITEEQVRKINKKYGLVCAPIDRYRGFVPASKLEEISSFKGLDRYSSHIRESDFLVVEWRYNSDDNKKNQKKVKELFPNLIFPKSMFESGYSSPYIRMEDGTRIEIKTYDEIKYNNLFICAPPKDMNMEGLNKYGELYATSERHTYVPDPVVLQPIKGGFLILAAWGEESSDEIVVNQTLN